MRSAGAYYHLAELSSLRAKKAVVGLSFCATTTNNKLFLFKADCSSGIGMSLLTNCCRLVVHKQHPTDQLVRHFQQKLYHSSLGASSNGGGSIDDVQTHTVPSLSAVVGEGVVGTSTTTTSSTSTLEVTTPTTTLEFTKFKRWSSEQVCSLLCVPVEQGGASLTEDEVHPLYRANFKGSSLANIIEDIMDKDKYFTLYQLERRYNKKENPQLSDTLKNVVNWVDNLLKTKLYHLWSKTQVEEQLLRIGVNENEAKVLIDSGNNWINLIQQTIEVPLIDFKYLTLKYNGFIDAFEVKIEKCGKGWVYSTNENEEKHIFSNVETIKQVCDKFMIVKKSTIRGRPSIEVLGQVRTGKTTTARYILPRVLADTINEDRIKNNRPKLLMAPTFYIRIDEKSKENFVTTLHDVLKPLRDVVEQRSIPDPDADVYNITRSYNNFTMDYPNVHLFIILDEVQLLDSDDLTEIREFAKSREYTNVTFILTGSTQGPFIKVIDGVIKNGLAYREGAIKYSVPTDNTLDVINDTFQFHKKTPFTEQELHFIGAIFGGVNCATLSQIIKIMEQGSDFKSAIQTVVVKGIFDKFDRDVLLMFSGRKLSDEMVSMVMYGLLTEKAYHDTFYKYITYFVDETEKLDSNGKRCHYFAYPFKDKLLLAYMKQRFTIVDGVCTISKQQYTPSLSYYIIMEPLFRFGERIIQCQQKNKYSIRSISDHQEFWKTNYVINNLADSDIDYMYKIVYQCTKSNRNTLQLLTTNSTKIEKIFIMMNQVDIHANSTSIQQLHDEMLSSWFKNDQTNFYCFINEISEHCQFPLF